jgi:hypothetical protein
MTVARSMAVRRKDTLTIRLFRENKKLLAVAALATAATGVTNGGRVTEVPSNSGSNVNYDGLLSGPVRAGSFASLNYGGASRELSGGTYYGAMEMSGNVDERAVTTGSSGGRDYTGVHGDGVLDSGGGANQSNWPTTTGASTRGGSSTNVSGRLRVSDRNFGASVDGRHTSSGGRGVRTAP